MASLKVQREFKDAHGIVVPKDAVLEAPTYGIGRTHVDVEVSIPHMPTWDTVVFELDLYRNCALWVAAKPTPAPPMPPPQPHFRVRMGFSDANGALVPAGSLLTTAPATCRCCVLAKVENSGRPTWMTSIKLGDLNSYCDDLRTQAPNILTGPFNPNGTVTKRKGVVSTPGGMIIGGGGQGGAGKIEFEMDFYRSDGSDATVKPPTCECGATAVRSQMHSNWCPLVVK